MTGPCLCGDPYCGACGDPGLALFEEFIDGLSKKLEKYDDIECRLFVAAGTAAVDAYKETVSRGQSDDWTPYPDTILGE